MIQSMTGYGAAEHVEDGVCYALEIRSVNHRYLKLSIKVPEYLQFLETDIDRQVRKRMARGAVVYTLRVRGEGETDVRPLNVDALQRYVDQMVQVRLPERVKATVDLAAIAALPGVCGMADLDDEAKKRERDVVATLTDHAMDALIDMRREEGKALYEELRQCCGQMRTLLAEIGVRAPRVVDEYHDRLRSRVETLLRNGGFELEEEGLRREVAIYAERCDITEELARLASHLDQAVQLCQRDEQVGRTLDFLSQEMLREANTIASKSNDSAIARAVVQIKGTIDRVKEQAQNVE